MEDMYLEIRSYDNTFEGTSDNKPELEDIEMMLARRGYPISNDVDIFYDEFQEIWRFRGDLF